MSKHSGSLSPSKRRAGLCQLLWVLLLAPVVSGQEGAPPARSPSAESATTLPADVTRRQSGKRYQEAIALARKAITVDPDAPNLHYALGSLLYAVDDYRGAIAEFEAEIERSPDHYESLRGLASAHAGLGELEAALPYLSRCLELQPGAADVAFELGRVLSDLGRLDDAEPYLRGAAESLNTPYTLVELGVFYRRRGDLDRAGEAFRRALAVDARDPAALFNYGQTLVLQGRRDEGAKILDYHARLATEIDDLERFGNANRLDASHANFMELARLHRRRGDHAAALEAYANAVALEPRQVSAMLGGAEVHLERGDVDRAGRWAGRAASLAPGDPRPSFLLGLVNLRRGQPRAAEIDFERSRAAGDWGAAEYRQLGETHRHLGNLEAAAAAFEQVVTLDPQDARGHRELARVRWLRGEEAPALESIARAVELDPDDGDAWMLAGVIRHAAGQDAEAAFRAALAAQTVDLLAAGGLERILERHADLPGAEEALELYRRLYERR